MKVSISSELTVKCVDLSSPLGKRGQCAEFPLPNSGHLPKGYQFVAIAPMHFGGLIIYVERKWRDLDKRRGAK